MERSFAGGGACAVCGGASEVGDVKSPLTRASDTSLARSALTWVAFTATLLVIGFTPAVLAQNVCVTPSAEVETVLIVRRSASVESPALGRLLPSAQAKILGEVPHWYLVATADGKTGYTSKNWARLTTCATAGLAGGAYEMHAIDVGTGLSLFVRGDDFTLLYDAGSNDDTAGGAKNRVVAYLAETFPDLRRIDHLILSHPHRDHLELMADVFTNYEVGEVWDSGATYDSCIYRDFIRAVSQEPGVRYHTALRHMGTSTAQYEAKCRAEAESLALRHGARIDTNPVPLGDGASMQFVYVDGSKRSDVNDNSLVLRMDLGGRSALLAGDAGGGPRKVPSVPPSLKSIEATLMACCQKELKADVLVVGHHGSMTSSRAAFLDAVGAYHFIVSSGPYKYSGTSLPDKEVIAELDRRGDVWRTDLDDDACAKASSKVGLDNDEKPGGCHNVAMRFNGAGVSASYVPALLNVSSGASD